MDAFTESVTVTADNPLLRGHVVYGRSLLPGVGYVDLVLQVLARHGHAMSDVELRKLTIFAPLVAAPEDQVLTTVEGRPGPTGGWRIEVRSRRQQDARDVLHAVVIAHRRAPPAFREKLALPITGATGFTPLADIYTWCREHELVHSGLMKIGGGVHHRPGDWVAELELAPAYHGSTQAFLFHPALFEAGLLGGGVAIGMLHKAGDGPGLYLPLMFESFRAAAPLGKRCFVRVPVDSVQRDEELVRLKVEFYDEAGVQVAEIGQFVGKRVRVATSLDVREEPASADAPAVLEPRSSAEVGTTPAAANGSLVAILRDLVAARLKQPSTEVGLDTGYYELGLASADLLSVVTELEDRLSLSLSPTIMFEYKTIADLAAMLEEQLAQQHAGSLPAVAAPDADPAPETTAAQPRATTPLPRDTGSAELLSAVRAALMGDVSALLNVPVAEVDPDIELRELGFDGTSFAQLAGRLDERYGVALASSVLLEHRTVQAVAAYLVDAHRERAAARHASVREPVRPVPLVRDTGQAGPHPMLGRAMRNGDDVAYETRFAGSEPYLQDHQVQGNRVLPGAAHLEMARAAAAAAMGAEYSGRLRLSDVVWLRPAICGPNGLVLSVNVRRTPGGGREYAIHSVDDDGGRTLCSQGSVGQPGDAPSQLPLNDLRAACSEAVFPAAHVYELYARMGMDYGPAQRSLAELRVGKDDAGRAQVLAELRLPAEAKHLGQCQLHPSILDGALQATIGLWLTAIRSGSESKGLALPFALDQLDAAAVTPARAYAWIRHQRGSKTDAASARLDVTVVDEHGRVCAELTGLSTRSVSAPRTTDEASPLARNPASAGRPPASRRAEADQRAIPEPVRARTDIAIVGVSGRYPGAADLKEFWSNLRSGRDCIREVPAERWDHRRYASSNGFTTSKWGGFLDDIDRFDPLFFQISLLEAEHLDPQERMFLECVHHALEDAGYTSDRVAQASKVGVFVGVMYLEYQLFGAQAQEHGHPVALWGSASTIANRVSYFYDFHGPSMAVDTMCSSSLTAIHLACEAIKSGQCEAAIAGGVNLTPHPNKYLVLSQRRFLSSDGRCRSFGEGGDGYVPGEGVGAVLLKPLERAVADGDHIYGVIKGTALNHGGRTSGYSVPTPVAQGEVIAGALMAAGVDPRSLSYLEAHGTGTSLGDPIEIAGLAKAFRKVGSSPSSCAIGSVKSNIGHCESAAGISAVTKVLLQMQHGELVPSLHSGTLNPHIDFDRTPLRVQQRLEPWQRPRIDVDGEYRTFPRIAGVSSFGGGGSNAHVVISEHVPRTPRRASSSADLRPALLVLSAKSEAQLVEQARRLHARLAELSDEDLLDVAWTLQTGRMALEERLALAATSLEAARSRLESFVADPRRSGGWVRGTVRPDRKTSDAELRSAMSDWSERGAYDRLLRSWADGAAVDWESIHPSTASMRRISLPGYPFARERCWLDLVTSNAPDEPFSASSAGATEIEPSRQGDDAAEPDEVMLLRPGWTARDVVATDGPGAAGDQARFEHHVLVVGRLAARERDALWAALPAGVTCELVEPEHGPLDRQYTEVAKRVFSATHGILARGGMQRPVLLQVALVDAADTDAERERLACFGGVAGLLKTVHLEKPLLHTQYVECLDGAPPATIAARLMSEATGDPEPEVRYRDGRRFVGRVEELTSAHAAAAPWKRGGIYLITGGAGALGLIVAREIAASAGRATVVLTGRSALSDVQQRSLDGLRASGLIVDHQRADVTDRSSVASLLAHVADSHGQLTGVVHSAGVIDDGFVVRKSPEALVRVLAPKVAGLVNLDELTRDQPLDVFLCFSSLSGAFGNPGQSNYAAANAFMDAYAVYRNRLVDAGLRNGTTVSIDWPLWDEGGMGNHAAVREQLRKLGVAPLDTPRGLTALRCALAVKENGLEDGRLLVISGRRSMLLPRLTPRDLTVRDQGPGARRGESVAGDEPTAEPALGRVSAGAADGAPPALEERAVGYFRRMMAGALKLGPERVDVDTPLERYGMDSVLAVNLVSRLEESFGSLSRTLLFEVQTVRALARYLSDRHAPALRRLLGEPALPRQPLPSPDTAIARLAPQASSGAPQRESFRSETEASTRPGAHAQTHEDGRAGAIAIVGISGRYPLAEDLDAFWANLRTGKDCVTEVPADRGWSHGRSNHAKTNGAGRSLGRWWGSFLEGVDRFDPLFFGISPREAAMMDPQQRLFLETAWHLLEQGGVTQEVIERRYGRRVGVYVGASSQMYRADESDPALAALTSAASYNLIANRVSHFFGLEGPSLAVDSMCTSAAMAIHLACADLQRGEAELAIAGGVNLTIHPDKYVALSEMKLLGSHPGSRSHRDGDGYLPAEGVGAVLLKPLDAAVRDGDTIHAVITGTASVHGGRANGFMTPSHRARVSVMRRALERAGVEPDSIGYVEDSADGSTLTDEVGLGALREVFSGVTEPVALGTVKSNLGHPEAASGIAQLTKVVLQLQHGEIAPLVEVGSPNPNLHLEGTPLKLCGKLTAWEPRKADRSGRPVPRRALINSVAAGGSHVSLVVEAPPRIEAAEQHVSDARPQLVVLSAKSREGLLGAARRLHDFLARHGSVDLADVAYTSQLGREALPERLAVVATFTAELQRALAHHLAVASQATDPEAAVPAVPVYRGNAEDDVGPLAAVLSGSRGEAILSGLVADRELERLAELWVRGVKVPWSGLHDGRRRLVPLPPTVFEAGTYWVGRKSERPISAAPEPASGGRATTSGNSAAAAPSQDRAFTPTEQVMAAAWAEVLQIDIGSLSAKSSFFSLGGNSLLASRLINLLQGQVGVELPVQAVFNAPRLSEMAAELERHAPVAVHRSKLEMDETDVIMESLNLVESMSDEQLDAVATGSAQT
jgi:polyketide synthase PksL